MELFHCCLFQSLIPRIVGYRSPSETARNFHTLTTIYGKLNFSGWIRVSSLCIHISSFQDKSHEKVLFLSVYTMSWFVMCML